jgi:hypothetical protein
VGTPPVSDARVRTFATCLLAAIALASLAGCGGGGGSESGGPPVLKSARIVDSKVHVDYELPDGDGSAWPELLVSVLEPEARSTPFTEGVSPVESEGELVLPGEVGPDREIIVFGSALAADGRRVYLQEIHLRSPHGAEGDVGDSPPGSAAAHQHCLEAETRNIPKVHCGADQS